MGANDIGRFASAVNSEKYYEGLDRDRRRFIKLIKEHGVNKGLDEAKKEDVLGKNKSLYSLKITFNSPQAQLEPIYNWIIDFVQDWGWEVEKITDNFTASPGSAQFSEMGQRVTRMQEEAMKILGGLNQVVKSSLNLIYDLKEFELRLSHYDDSKSSDPKRKESGMLALKQIWLDSVDIKRGNGAIHALATAQAGFVTIREAFMSANSLDELKKMEDDKEGGLINKQVIRILIPRMSEFLNWIDYSEKELRKRMNIERSYLKSQVETIKLYSQWMKPYLKAAEELRQKGFDKHAALVNAFSTSMFELTLLAKDKTKVPEKFGRDYKLKREYYSIVVIGLNYRGHVSQRVTQKGDYGFAMGGRIDMTFDAYAFNEEEYKLVMDAYNNEEVAESMSFSGDVAEEALKELKEDLEHFLKDDKKEEAEMKKKKKSDDINPFSALFELFKFGAGKKDKKEKKIEGVGDIKQDNFVEKDVRKEAENEAKERAYTIYDVYKKANGMASAPGKGFDK